MFSIVLYEENYRFLFGRFEPFVNKEGVLPSFEISPHFNDSSTYNEFVLNSNYVFTISKKIAGYYFYKKYNDLYSFSLGNIFAFMDTDFSKVDLYTAVPFSSKDEKDVSFVLMKAYAYRLIMTNSIMIHAACIVYNSEGILFCGVSGAGKSTQAKLWCDNMDAWVLNYDKPCIVKNKNTYFVSGCPWSGKEDLFINESFPIKAIVFIKKSNDNRVRRLSLAEAYSNMYLLNYIYPLSSEIEKKYDSVITDIIMSVTLYELQCTISQDAVDVLHNALYL